MTAPQEHALSEFELQVAGRRVSVHHHGALVTWVDEQRYLGEEVTRRYGFVLWPAAIALALEIASRGGEFRARRVLELGAGVGLPGIVAATLGAHVVQTDRDPDAIALCAANAERNTAPVETRVADWSAWTDEATYDWVIASDILYRTTLHDQLSSVINRSVSARGTLLIADPLRPASMPMLERMERDGWSVQMSRYTIGEGELARSIGVFELRR